MVLAYKRAEILKRTLISLESADQVNVSEIHIVLQGNDSEVRSVLNSVNWKYNLIQTNYSLNVSAKEAINRNLYSGLSSAFENRAIDYVVVLEDDICVSKDFFNFVFAVYNQNHLDGSFRAINGFSGIPRELTKASNYGRYRFGVGWGWALPRRTWEALNSIWMGNEDQHWDGLIESFMKTGYVVAPGMSRILNIGFGDGATHTNATHDPQILNTQQKIEASFIDLPLERSESLFTLEPSDLMWREDCRVYRPEIDFRGRCIQLLYILMHQLYSGVYLSSWVRPVERKLTSLLREIAFRLD